MVVDGSPPRKLQKLQVIVLKIAKNRSALMQNAEIASGQIVHFAQSHSFNPFGAYSR